MLTAGDGASIRGGITLYFRTAQVDALYEEIGGLADVRFLWPTGLRPG